MSPIHATRRTTRSMSTNDRWENDDEFERQERLHQRGAWSGQFHRWGEHDQQQVWRGEYHGRHDRRGERETQKCWWGCRKEGWGSEVCHVKKILQSKNIQKSQSGECTETASVQITRSDAESVEYKNLSFIVWNVGDQAEIRPPRCPPVTEDPIYVFGSNGAWLRMRMKTVKVHQMQLIDEVKVIRPSIPRNVEWFMWVPLREIGVSSSSCMCIDGDSK